MAREAGAGLGRAAAPGLAPVVEDGLPTAVGLDPRGLSPAELRALAGADETLASKPLSAPLVPARVGETTLERVGSE